MFRRQIPGSSAVGFTLLFENRHGHAHNVEGEE